MPSSNQTFTDKDWQVLLSAIKEDKCTPVIGPGFFHDHNSQNAKLLAAEYAYPLEDKNNLARVAQFVAIQDDRIKLSRLLTERANTATPPNFNDPHEPYTILATLPFPLYLTTNFDDWMEQALTRRNKEPHKELCLWTKTLWSQGSPRASGHEPSTSNPIVFHFYGTTEVAESLVVTEDNYLDFLFNLGKDEALLPHVVQRACASTLLLFLGFRFDDLIFRVLFKTLSEFLERSTRRRHIAVAVLPDPSEATSADGSEALEYFSRYLEPSGVRIYWGTVQTFAAELRERVEYLNGAS